MTDSKCLACGRETKNDGPNHKHQPGACLVCGGAEPNDDRCSVCYHCQTSVAPEITADDIKANGGKIMPDWATDEVKENCENSFSCQKCVTSQA